MTVLMRSCARMIQMTARFPSTDTATRPQYAAPHRPTCHAGCTNWLELQFTHAPVPSDPFPSGSMLRRDAPVKRWNERRCARRRGRRAWRRSSVILRTEQARATGGERTGHRGKTVSTYPSTRSHEQIVSTRTRNRNAGGFGVNNLTGIRFV